MRSVQMAETTAVVSLEAVAVNSEAEVVNSEVAAVSLEASLVAAVALTEASTEAAAEQLAAKSLAAMAVLRVQQILEKLQLLEAETWAEAVALMAAEAAEHVQIQEPKN
ncbi:hypothetical protein IW143_003629 [Coemansia sp. RSA 520]|nr:hypothetical protein IW143_003629 [Coemansia sp. RSA 520]